MRAGWCCAVLALAACNAAPDRQPAGQASEAARGIAAAAPSAKPASNAADVHALLDAAVIPRQQGTYPPADECARLPGAEDFRRALAAAVLAKDANAVASLALPTVRLGFGGDDGRERLRQQLSEGDGKLMAELAALLRLGCAADAEGGMTMPWYFAQDFGDVDSYSAMLVTGAEVPLFAAPDARSMVRQRLSWDLVTLAGGPAPGKPFQQVTAADGASGYVASEKLRSLLAYRLLAARQGGIWRISALVSGD
jgi:hypothetical protein